MSERSGDGTARLTIFDLLTTYHRSLENMKAWLAEDGVSEVDRVGIADAWQEEARQWFRDNGYCFTCNRKLARCACSDRHV